MTVSEKAWLLITMILLMSINRASETELATVENWLWAFFLCACFGFIASGKDR